MYKMAPHNIGKDKFLSATHTDSMVEHEILSNNYVDDLFTKVNGQLLKQNNANQHVRKSYS